MPMNRPDQHRRPRPGTGPVLLAWLIMGVLGAALLPVSHAGGEATDGAGAITAPAPSPPGEHSARAAAAWLAAQSDDGVYGSLGTPDWGLTADAVVALAAARSADDAARRSTERLQAAVDEFASPAPGPDDRVAGALAKLLLVALVRGHDPTDFGGWDLPAELLRTLRDDPGGRDDGRFSDFGTGGADTSNGFTQALAVTALARLGRVPPSAVAHLLRQQCPGGGFRLFLVGQGGCTQDSAADGDTTGLAVQALLAVGTADAVQAATRAGAFLVAQQRPDGSVGGSGPTAAPNVNSTALAAQSLRGLGRTVEADRAEAWVRSLQLGCDAPAADRGAIAYNGMARAEAVGQGISPARRDQFLRATTQAVLGLGAAPLGDLVADGSSPVAAPLECAGTTTTTTAPPTTTTTTPTTSPEPTTSAVPTSTVPPIAGPTGRASPAATGATVAAGSAARTDPARVSADPPPAVAGATTTSPATGRPLALTGAASLITVVRALALLSAGSALLAVRRRHRRDRPER